MQISEVKRLNRGCRRGSSPVKGGWDGQRRAVAWRCGLLPVYIPYGCMAELDCGCGAPVYGNEGSLVQSVNRSWNIIVPRRRCHHQGGAWYRPRTLPRCYKKEDKENKSSRSKSRGGAGHLKSPKTAAGSREKQVFRLLSGLKPKLPFSSTELNPSESFQTDCCAAKHPFNQNGFYRSDDDIHIFPEASAICLDEGLICATWARTDSCSMPTPRHATGC